MLSRTLDSPSHYSYEAADWVAILPGGDRVVDSGSAVFTLPGLDFAGSFGGPLGDLEPYGERTVGRRDNSFILFNERYDAIGNHTPDFTILDYTIYNDQVIVFTASGRNVTATPVSFDVFGAPQPVEPINPTGLVYTPDSIEAGNDGILYILSKENYQVFRWLVAERRYLSSITLREAPIFMTYSPENASLYFAYSNGRLTSYETDLVDGEEFLANLPGFPGGLVAAGEYLFTVDPVDGTTYRTYRHTGELIDSEWIRAYESRLFVWSPGTRRVYHFRDGISPNDVHGLLINADGTLDEDVDSPDHGGVDVSLPLSVSPTGHLVITGGGIARRGDTLARAGALSNVIAAAGWYGEVLHTGINLDSERVFIQRWTTNFGVDKGLLVKGQVHSIHRSGEEMIFVTMSGGKPRFNVATPDLRLLSPIDTTGFVLQ